MVNINNSSRAYGSNGMLGLATGMDTESIIESMLSGTQAKIDKQNGLKQQAVWKQNIYRDIIAKFQNLQNNFFNVLNPNANIGSSSLFQSKSVNFNSNAIKVTASGSATQIKINEIKQLASGSKISSTGTCSGDLKLDVDVSKLKDGATIELNVDGVKKTFNLTGASNAEIISNLNNDITKSFGSAISVGSDGSVNVAGNRHVTISGDADGLVTIGFNASKSNKISLSTALKDLNLSSPLAGDTFKFKINGQEFSFNANQTLNDVIRTVNNSDANVKLSYSTLDDKFTIESKTLGKGVVIETEETEGNLLASLFQTKSSGNISSNSINYTNNISGQNISLGNDYEGGAFTIKVNGSLHTLNIEKKTDDDGNAIAYTKDEVIAELNKQLASKFGADAITLTEKNGALSVGVNKNIKVEFEAEDGSLNGLLGLTNQNNLMTDSSTLGELNLSGTITINNNTFTLNANDKIDDLLNVFKQENINASFVDGKIKIESSTNVTISGELSNKLFNSSSIELNKPGNELTVVDGQNAVLVVNGQTIERSTNNFELDGFNITLSNTSSTAIDIVAEDNVDAVFDTITKFVKDYNQLLDDINKLTGEKTEYKNYPPLTDAQKKDMSEKEIELWEEKAKTGLLARDATLTGVLGQLRSILFNKPEGSNLSLADIGIETKNYADKGKLTIDEAKLKKALQNNMKDVENLFTNPENGIAKKFNEAIDSAVKSSTSKPGSLVVIAGIKNAASAGNNNLSRQMDNYDKTINNLKRTYEMQKARYWKQFSSLETVISKMNSQSSWLSQQFG